MRRFIGTAFVTAAIAASWHLGPAAAQPGHAPFVFGALEIENYERTLAPAGIAGATVIGPSIYSALNGGLGNHPAVIANGNQTTNYQTGAPIFLDRTQSAWQHYGGILGSIGTPVASNYNDLFPGGTAVSPGGFPNGTFTRNNPLSSPTTVNTGYNGTLISLVTNTDGNTEDDVGITSGNQALRVSMLNVGQGDGNTSFDRPAMLTIKETDFWGVEDSRFDTFEMVRANVDDFNISIDITMLANEIPDTFDMTPIGGNPVGPYTRMGFISGIAGTFDEAPNNIVQHPPALNTNNGDDDGDGLVNFTDPDYVEAGNPSNLPGYNVPGVFQRRYVFPANALTWPANPLAGVADTGGNRHAAGGGGNAYMLGFVFNGSWELNTYASFIVDNIRFIDRFPIASADFDKDGNVDGDDWNILRSHLNSQDPVGFMDGDIGQAESGEEGSISPGVVDFQDFIRFEEIYNQFNGGDGAFQQLLAGVPEPSCAVLLMMGLAALACGRRRVSSRLFSVLVVSAMALVSTTAIAVEVDTLLFSFEDGSFPDELQRWAPAQTGGVDNGTVTSSTVGVTQGTQSLALTQTLAQSPGAYTAVGFVSIFGSESGLPDQFDALNTAMNVGANNYHLDMDITFTDAGIPAGASFAALRIGLTGGAATNDFVDLPELVTDGATNTGPIHVSIPMGIGTVNTADGILTMPNQPEGSYNLTFSLDGDWTGNATFYADNIVLNQVSQPPLLTLEINTTSGVGTLKNTPGVDAGTGDVIFDYYEIRSQFADQAADFNGDGTVNAADYTVWRDNLGLMDTATQDTGDANGDGDVTRADYDEWKAAYGIASGGNGTSLNPGGWNSLDDQNVDPNGTAVENNWAETLTPSSSVLTEARLIGSSTWSNAESRTLGNIYTPGSPQNIQLFYREPFRRNFLRQGLVTYVTSGGGGLAVPEPGTLVLVLSAGLAVAGFRRS